MIFSLFRNNFWDRQNWEKYPVGLYLYFYVFQNMLTFLFRKTFFTRYEIIKHKFYVTEVSWAFVTIRTLIRQLRAIIWHETFWYRYQHVKFGNLGSIFLLTFSMVKMHFQKSIPYWKWSTSSYLSHTWWNRGGLVFLGIRYRGTVFFCGFCPGPGLVNKESHFLELVNIKKNVKQPGFFMRQKIKFTNFYL